MNATALGETVVLGVITGMRSMAGPAALALRSDGILKQVVPLMAIGEMVADKTTVIGDRTDALPLAGRAFLGALVGGIVAHRRRRSIVAHGLIGASVAVVAAHLACRARKQLPMNGIVSGLFEDSLVFGLAGLLTTRARPSA